PPAAVCVPGCPVCTPGCCVCARVPSLYPRLLCVCQGAQSVPPAAVCVPGCPVCTPGCCVCARVPSLYPRLLCVCQGAQSVTCVSNPVSPRSLHGNPLTDTGLALLNPALAGHPSLLSLDLGDCLLGDEGISLICGLLPPDGAKPGLRELTLSANPAISCLGWARLAIGLSHSSQVRTLNLDYNPLGDHIASMLAVCVASSRTLEVLDLEGTGLTNKSAQILLDMVQNYPTPLKSLVLSENNISLDLQQQIADLLSEGEEEEEYDGRLPEQPVREKGLKHSQGTCFSANRN
uniref:Leucine rich repeat containing 73 n=1 Tax=Xenopus tropicalis TaxID=8364 RepID=A0A803JVS6_XENTR